MKTTAGKAAVEAGFDQALDQFLSPWRKRREVAGALVCGSYVTGSPSAHSDLDVHIVLADGARWQERGNRKVSGFLVEYFVNPPSQIRTFFQSDLQRNRPMTATMFATGRVLFDPQGVVAGLTREAEKVLRRPFPKLQRKQIETMKYFMWDSLDNLEEASEARIPLAHGYHDHLHGVYSDYARFLRQPVLPSIQLYRYLREARFRKKYRMSAFPDAHFRKLLIEALEARSREGMMRCARALTGRALQRMGGIEIDGWRTRFRVSS